MWQIELQQADLTPEIKDPSRLTPELEHEDTPTFGPGSHLESRCYFPNMAALRNELTQPWKFGKTNQIFVSESLTKFVELWGSGKSATFNIECRNGEARFNFSALLGSPEDVKKPEAGHESQPSPSKQKRNWARLEAFLEKKKRESCLEESFLFLSAKIEENVERESCSAKSSIEVLNNNEREPCLDRGTETERLVELRQSSLLLVEIPSPGIRLQIESWPDAKWF